MTGQVRSAWTQALARGDRPDAAALRAHLAAVHRAAPGFTEPCAARCVDAAGRSSYDWLAELATGGAALDLACGSGVLLERLHRRDPGLRLTGVDMSADELALARARLPDGAATLTEGLAQAMPAVPDASQDAVLCHWALTLMDPLPPVLAEVARVLRAGGVFAALVDGPPGIAPGYAEVSDLIYDRARAATPRLGEAELGDVRARDAAALAALAATAFPGARITVEHAVVAVSDAPRVLADLASGFFYAAFLLPDDDRAAMLAALTARFAAMAEPRFSMPVSRLVVRT